VKLNGTHQLLVYAYDVILLCNNIDTIEKNTRTLTDASKEVGLEVNTEKIKYMLLSHHKNAGQNHDIMTTIRCLDACLHLIFPTLSKVYADIMS
jgi:hypothetical protein